MKIIDNKNIEVHKLELEIEKTGHITNSYVIKDKKTAGVFVIDPAFNEIIIKQAIEDMEGIFEGVIITHSHADHISALTKLVENTEVKVYVHKNDYEGLYNKDFNAEDIVGTKVLPVDNKKVVLVDDKFKIVIGETLLEVVHTPGHTAGSMILFDETNNIIYSGDTIFEKTYGRTDLINGSRENMKSSLDKIFDMFNDILVLPGHGNEFNLKDSKRKIRLLFAYKG